MEGRGGEGRGGEVYVSVEKLLKEATSRDLLKLTWKIVPMTNILPMTMSTGSCASIRPMGVSRSSEFRAPWKPKFDQITVGGVLCTDMYEIYIKCMVFRGNNTVDTTSNLSSQEGNRSLNACHGRWFQEWESDMGIEWESDMGIEWESDMGIEWESDMGIKQRFCINTIRALKSHRHY